MQSRWQMSVQRGLSLIEFMIALVLGALVLLGTVSLFQQSRSSSAQDEQVARMQENGRYALRLLSRELAMMGYWGGMLETSAITYANVTGGITADCNSGWVLDFAPAIEVGDNVTSSSYSCISDAEILDGTDMFAIKRVADSPALSNVDGTTYVDDPNDPLDPNDPGADPLVDGSIYLKTNTSVAAMFDASGNKYKDLVGLVDNYGVWAYLPQIYYVRPYSTTDGGGNPADNIPTLVREFLVGKSMQAQPLVDGIENLQIEFGIDGTDADLAPDYYTAAPSSTELGEAVSARIYLLVRSIDPVAGYTNDKTYQLGSQTVAAANDNFYRRVYSTTVQLRNADKLKLYALN